jgi:hypothetical protein
MSLVDEVTALIDSEGVYNVIGNSLTRTPSPEEITERFEALGALCKGLRLAIRHLAREIEDSRDA